MFKKAFKDFGLLIKEQFYRMTHSKVFFVLAIILAVATLGSIVIYAFANYTVNKLIDYAGTAEGLSSSLIKVNSIIADHFAPGNMGIYVLIFVSVFVGSEFNQHTIRNKIAAGFSRTAIYLSSLTMSYIVTIVYALIISVIMLAIGTPLLGWQYSDASVLYTFAILSVNLPTVAVIHMVCYLVRSRGASIGINIAIILVASGLSSVILFIYSIDQNIVCEWIIRVLYLTMNNYVTTVGVSELNTMSYFGINLVVTYLLTTIIAAVGGWLAFKRAEIK